MTAIAFIVLAVTNTWFGAAWLNALRRLDRAERERDDLWDEYHLGDAP